MALVHTKMLHGAGKGTYTGTVLMDTETKEYVCGKGCDYRHPDWAGVFGHLKKHKSGRGSSMANELLALSERLMDLSDKESKWQQRALAAEAKLAALRTALRSAA